MRCWRLASPPVSPSTSSPPGYASGSISSSNSLLMRNLLHGWQVSGIYTARSGNPVNITQSTAFSASRGDYIGAINRFRVVVERYQRTPQIAEALERLTEAYYALGVYDEAKAAAAVLGANYPGSRWYQDSYALLVTHNMKPELNPASWISKLFQSPI